MASTWKEGQKRFLTITLKEVHALYLEENAATAPVSLSKFASLRPAYVRLRADTPHNVCVCKYHENVRLLLITLSRHNRDIPTDFKTFIDSIVCNQEDLKCMRRMCDECDPRFAKQFCPTRENETEMVTWHQWTMADKRVVKAETSGTLKECFEELQQQLEFFLVHTFIKRRQNEHFERMKSAVDGKQIVVQVDFAENYAILEQNEIQSAHWCHDQVTVFTAYAWVNKNKGQSYAIISNELQHGKYAVHAFLDYLLRDLKATYPDITKVNFISDGAASQFKQKFLFTNLTFMEEVHHIKVVWNFFATSHGKGVVDGIGGHVKRLVWIASMTGTRVINSETFADIAASRAPNIKVMHISSVEIEQKCLSDGLNERWDGIIPIPATHQIHCVRPAGKYVVEAKLYSTCAPEEIRVVSMKPDISVDVADQQTVGTSDSCDKPAIQQGAFLLVRFDTKRSVRKFIGQVMDSDGINYDMTFLRKSDSAGKIFHYPAIEDRSWISSDQIVEHLKEHTVDKRNMVHFKLPVLAE